MCREAHPHIVLAEGKDARVVEAAARAEAQGLAQTTVLGVTLDPKTAPQLNDYAHAYFELRKHKGITEQQAERVVASPLGFAAMMVRQGDADGTVSGAVETTGDVVRAALQIIGRAPNVSTVSSCFLMLLPTPHDRPVIFADCGLVLQPNAEELASIALASAKSLTALTGLTPKVAMLSFSTKGSVPLGAHESLGRIQKAMELVRAAEPGLAIDGELQFDAAFSPDVAARKAPDSSLAGAANVFVFPSLSAGNLGYKIAQRIGGAIALGPILQGLAKPANDLSRGASVDDIFQMIAITGAQSVR